MTSYKKIFKEVKNMDKQLKYLEKDKDITSLSNFKTKAFSEYYFEINEEKDLAKLMEISNFANKQNLKILFV
jgi:hypothetical protein